MKTSYDKDGAIKYTIRNYDIYLHRDNNWFYGHIDSHTDKNPVVGNGFTYSNGDIYYDKPYSVPKYVKEYLYKLWLKGRPKFTLSY